MSKVLAAMTISLDGFVTGPNDGPGVGLGDGGEPLHYWFYGGPWSYSGDERGVPADVDQALLSEVFSSGGAMICGRTTHDASEGWGDEPGFGMPMFVVTRRPHERVVKGNTSFDFVDGTDEALARARKAAAGKDVIVMGGADLLRQYLAAGEVDEFVLTIAPVLLGDGKRLFDGIARTDIAFERIGVVESPYATHLRFRVQNA